MLKTHSARATMHFTNRPQYVALDTSTNLMPVYDFDQQFRAVEPAPVFLGFQAQFKEPSKGSKLSEAYDVARDASDIPTVLFMRRDAVFVPMLEGHRDI